MNGLRIICTADLHLGCIQPLQQAPQEIQRARIEDGFKVFEEIAKHTIRKNADFFVICGDIFHTFRPSGYVFNRFARVIGDLSKADVQTLVVAGNHDMPRVADTEPYLSALEEVRAPRFYFFKEPKSVVLHGEKSGRRIHFVIIPYIHLINPEEDKRAEWVENNLRDLLIKGDGDYTVVLSHLVVEGSSLGILKELIPYPEPVISKELLFRNADLILLGHLHDYQVIEKRIIYPGSPERISFSEETVKKGFVEVYEEGNELFHRFVKTEARPLLSYPHRDYISLVGSDRPTEELREAISRMEIPAGAIVKLRFRLGTGQNIDWVKILEYLREKGALYAIPEWEREKLGVPQVRGAMPTIEALLKEFVDTSLKGKMPPAVVRLVKEKGLEIIREVAEEQ